MGILSNLLSGGIEGVAKAVDLFVQNPDEKAAADLKAQALVLQAQAQQMKPLLAQLEVNKAEAQHASVFVAGWRPATGWACGACMVGIVAASVYGWLTGFDVKPIMVLYASVVAPVHLGMLGLRTFERHKGIDRSSLKPDGG